MKKINAYYIYIFIILQPIIDVIAYFTFSPKITIISFLIRSILLFLFVLISFYKIKDKKKLIYTILPLLIVGGIHVLNITLRNGIVFGDIKNIFSIMQLPALAIIFVYLLKQEANYKKQITKGLITNFITIFLVIVLSILTKSYATTYADYGILGWFSGSNTPSMIITMLCPLFLIYITMKKSWVLYSLSSIAIIFLLFINGTRACYFSMIALFILMTYICIFMKKTYIKKYYVFISILSLLLSITLFPISTTNQRILINKEHYSNTQQVLENIELTPEEIEKNLVELQKLEEEIGFFDKNKIKEKDLEVYEQLKLSYLYVDVMKEHGAMPVIERMRDKISAETLADNRLVKRINSDIVFDKSDIITKLFGINYQPIADSQHDPENDITAIFYYLGYIGFSVYICYILYFVFITFKKFIKDKKIIINGEIIVLCYTYALAVLGGELTGAILRKPSANVYVAIIMGLIYIFCTSKEEKHEKKNNQITFLNLHLGYGGIETSTINSANTLSEKYDVEIISLYNLTDNQEKLLNKNIKVKYLYNGGPNKKELIRAIKSKNIFSCIKESFKAIKILYLKKALIIKSILECDSKFIVSTRWEFSKLLSIYKPNDAIAIAQEHHHHNNKKKYIKILSEEYMGIDYLFALNKSLEKDYKLFLKSNENTKIVVVPNMVIQSQTISDLNNKNIISVGRLHPGKRISEIVKMIPKLKNVGDFYIIGDGEDYTKIEELIKELSLTKKVKLLGYKNREEIEKYYQKSSVFVMASESEGLPMVLIEAMSSGLPCVAYETDCGVDDIIDNNENGYIVKNRNEKEYIEKLDELLGNPKKLKEFGKNAKQKANKFSPSEVFKKWEKILTKAEENKVGLIKTIKDFFKDLFSSKKMNNFLFLLSSFSYLVLIDIFNRTLVTNGIDIDVLTGETSQAFNIVWILLILILFSITKGWLKKITIITIDLILLIYSIVNYFVFSYFGNVFSWKDIVLSGDGMSFISSIFKYINSTIIIFIIISLILIIVSIILSKHNLLKVNSITMIIVCVVMLSALINYNNRYRELTQIVDGWNASEAINNNSNYYSTWINPNKLIKIGGTYDYIIRDFYHSFLKKENIKDSNEYIKEKLSELNNNTKNNTLNYEGLFKGKNLIFVMMESMDDWLIEKEVTPTISYMMKHGFNFNNHYSPVYVTGSTANTEFIANTGIYPNINKLSPNYAYTNNSYKYSLPNLFTNNNYIVNSFHRSSGTIYNRGIMHLSFGYKKYHNYNEMGISDENLDLDSHVAIDGYDKIVSSDKFMSFIITYSPHTPYTYDKIECAKNLKDIQKLKLNTNNEEEICGYSSARETDNMFKILIEKLKADGKLEDTVIIAFTDHPNYIKYSEQETNILNKTLFFIYNSELEEHQIDEISSTINILPTIKNLFALEGDYYYPGCDLLNCKENYVIFNDFTYYDGKEIKPLTEKQYADVNYSKHLLISDYYK